MPTEIAETLAARLTEMQGEALAEKADAYRLHVEAYAEQTEDEDTQGELVELLTSLGLTANDFANDVELWKRHHNQSSAAAIDDARFQKQVDELQAQAHEAGKRERQLCEESVLAGAQHRHAMGNIRLLGDLRGQLLQEQSRNPRLFGELAEAIRGFPAYNNQAAIDPDPATIFHAPRR